MTMLYIRFREGTDDELERLMVKGIIGHRRVLRDLATGGRFLVVRADPLDPGAVLPDIPAALIEKIEIRSEVFSPRVDGVYRYNGAELSVRSVSRAGGKARPKKIVVSGSAMEAVKTLFGLFREGSLHPFWRESGSREASLT